MSPPRIARSGDSFDRALLRAGRNDEPPRGAEDRALAVLGRAGGLGAHSIAVPRNALSAMRWGGPSKTVAVALAMGACVAGVWGGVSRRPALALDDAAGASAPAPAVVPDPGERPVDQAARVGERRRVDQAARVGETWAVNPLESRANPTPESRSAASKEPSVAPPIAAARPGASSAKPLRAPAPMATCEGSSALPLEIDLVQQAARALAGGNARETLDLLDTYDRRCARGVLVEEAGALRVRALARSGRAEEAKVLARTLIGAHPDGVLARSLQSFL